MNSQQSLLLCTGTGLTYTLVVRCRYIHPSALHGSSVLWNDDQTFRDPDYVATNNVGAAPSVVVGYQSEHTCNITRAQGNYNVGECHYGGPGFRLIHDGSAFVSFRAIELWSDSAEPERKGLGRRAMSRLLAPQSQEAPFTFHTGALSCAYTDMPYLHAHFPTIGS